MNHLCECLLDYGCLLARVSIQRDSTGLLPLPGLWQETTHLVLRHISFVCNGCQLDWLLSHSNTLGSSFQRRF